MINLQIDTEVYVKTNKSDDWKLRHFRSWGHNGDIKCYDNNITSVSCSIGQWHSWPYWRVAEGKYKGINNEEKILTEGRSNLALLFLIFGSSILAMNAVVKYLSYTPRNEHVLDFFGICSLTVFILIMIFGKK